MKKMIYILINIINKNNLINNIFLFDIYFIYKNSRFWYLLTIISIIFYVEYKIIISSKQDIALNNSYLQIQLGLNLTFDNYLHKKINIAVFYNAIKNGGVERLTALLLNYLNNIKIFNLFLFTIQQKEENEYSIPITVKRIIINTRKKNELIKVLNREKIDILIYHFYNELEIEKLNHLKKTKSIIYNNSCFFIWIYIKFYFTFKTIYKAYKNSKYIISLVPFENGYLFRKWGIKSILMNNFICFEYNYVIPSDLSSQTILMIGRGSDRMKRFDLGVEAMKHIVKEIPECEMKIISDKNLLDYLEKMVSLLNLEKNVKFMGYTSTPEIYYKNSSLHLFPTISESFGLILSETKIYGIPNILIGLDYISIAKGGTVILYDDNSISIAKEAIKILKDFSYRKKLGREARKSMQKFKNELLLKKWIKLIISIYNGELYYEKLREEDAKISKKDSLNILKKQLELLKIRLPNFKNITIKNIENFTFMTELDNFS